MNKYKYQAITKDGIKVSGVMEGYDELDAVDRIKEDCDIVLKITEVKESKPGILNMQIGGNKLNLKALTLLCSQFAIITKSGIPIASAVEMTAQQTTDKTLKKILEQVAEDVQGGRSLASALEDRGKGILPITFIETIRAGEESGRLEVSFDNMYEHYTKEVDSSGKVRNALIYPAFVLCIAVVVVMVLMIKVIPTFTEIFASYGAELPFMTKLLINISNFFRCAWPFMLAIVVIVFISVRIALTTEKGKLFFARLALKLPVIGNIVTLNAATQFAHNMAALSSAGLSITNSLRITSKVIDNYYISTEVSKIVEKIEDGYSLGKVLCYTECLPSILRDMIVVGEEAGELEQTLHSVGNYYNNELENAVNAAIKKLEPTVLVFVAFVAGFIVIAVYMAMFEMYGVM